MLEIRNKEKNCGKILKRLYLLIFNFYKLYEII